MAWLKTKLWPFIKKHWQVILIALGAILALWLGKNIFIALIKMAEGILVPQVKSPVPFMVHDATHVIADTPEGPKVVDVGALGMKSNDVKTVGWTGTKVEVQRDNPPL